MAKLFLFAIGGTGSRVVKALAMLLASGVEMHDTTEVIPIIIDPDSANGDLTRTVEILKTYKEIRDKSFSKEGNFFKTEISSLYNTTDSSNNFVFDIDGVKAQLFKQFIDYNGLDDKNKAFASLLFSKDNLESNMNIGFKGNPNIGSVVLNKFKDSDTFKKFASSFVAEDRIFIISSIFGGTGAAGFPVILKNIRDAKDPLPNHAFLKDAKIGAITILPYFGVSKSPNTTIDSNTFISKTKAALSYYATNVSGNNSINALYYIGDNVTNNQKGADGDGAQKNNAHFIELASALSIIDFMGIPSANLNVANGKATNPKFYEFGLLRGTNTIDFNDLAKETYDIIAKPLTQYALFMSFMDSHYEEFSKVRGEAWASHGKNKLAKESIESRFIDSIHQFNNHFKDWLNEMALSNVSFNEIDTSKIGNNIYNLIKSKPCNLSLTDRFLNASGVDNYLGVLSKIEPSLDYLDSTNKLMALFYKATKEIVEKDIKI